jgi:tRNA-specific 2-thiouridylase
MIDKDVLPHLVLPMGDYSKEQTRKLAAGFGLSSARRQESQEICFVPNDDWVAVLERRCPELVLRGDIIDSNGRVLGEHSGVHRFTIGQRRGLGVAMGRPYYVVKIDAEHNTVMLGPKEEVVHRRLRTSRVNWLTSQPELSFRARVKVRYNDAGAPATVYPQAESAVVEFDEPRTAITPGQLAVFYVEDGKDCRVVGGGWIDEVGD